MSQGARLYEPEPETIRAAARGDQQAFAEIVRGLQAPVWRFLRHLVGDAALAEDLTQETFIRVYRKLGSFRHRAKFSTWVFQIARNAGIDEIRSRERRSRLVRVLRPDRPAVRSGPETGVEVQAALTELSPKLREAFLMVEVLGLTYREAGGALGVPEGTVKSRVHHARAALVAWLEAAEEETSGEV